MPMTHDTETPRGARWATPLALAAGGVRVVLGLLWLGEAITKFRAGFGAADILLVGQSPRVPEWFAVVREPMQALPDLFGIGIPLFEAVLAVTLILGLWPRIAAFVSIGTLGLYWASDQLIGEYPVMLVLSALVLAVPSVGRFGVLAFLRRRGA